MSTISSTSTSSRRSPLPCARCNVSRTAARGGSKTAAMNAARNSPSSAQSAHSGPITSGGRRRNAPTNSFRHSSRSHSVQPVSGGRTAAESPAQRVEHQPLAVSPAPVDRRLRRPRAARDVLEREAAVAGPPEHLDRGLQHRGVDLRVTRPAGGAHPAIMAGGRTPFRRAGQRISVIGLLVGNGVVPRSMGPHERHDRPFMAAVEVGTIAECVATHASLIARHGTKCDDGPGLDVVPT